MLNTQLYDALKHYFPYKTTQDQDDFLKKITPFIAEQNNDFFILKGYAGTGKTTLITSLVKVLNGIGKKCVLMAPTGRAAKVMGNYSNEKAFTIHKRIYFPKKNSGTIQFTLQPNKFKSTLFIVDEASMISDAPQDNRTSLLDDLIQFVFSGNNCQLLLIGDTAQLPPVKSLESPALNVDYISRNFPINGEDITLKEVMRQSESSGILYNATTLRSLLQTHFTSTFQFDLYPYTDVIRLQDGYDIQDAIHQAYYNYSIEDTCFIVRSNKRANQYNQQIRLKILDKESDLSPGDYLMIVKNNYFWLNEKDDAGFLANGDIIEVLQIYKFIDLYGFQFAHAQVRMIDYPNQPPLDTVLLLSTINAETPALSYEDSQKLYQEVALDYVQETSKYKQLSKIKSNPYFNALQVKFAYALTCHKAQGGQWQTIFIEQPYLPDGINEDYVRWLYTAITRSQSKVYLIGFKDEYFKN